MAGTFDAGSVIYEVDMDTSRLLAARREVDAITSAKNEEIAKINAETERLNATVAQKEMDLANIGSVIGAIVVVLVLFVLFINLK